MTKTALSFLAGAISVGVTAFVTNPQPSAFGFSLGMITAVATIAALIGSAQRARRVARFLLIVADGIDGKSSRMAVGTAVTPKQAVEMPGPIERDVISALQNFGMPKKAAAQLARRTIAGNPAADLTTALDAAMKSSRKAVAV